MKPLTIISLILTASFFFTYCDKSNTNPDPGPTPGIGEVVLPVVSGLSIENITSSGAKCTANVTSDGGAMVSARGVCWSTSENPTIELDTKITSGGGGGSFSCTISGQQPGVKYYVRAFATNSKGTAYSNSQSFTTTSSSVSWMDDKFYRRSLTMRFTATWCGYCPQMGKAIDLASTAMPGRILPLSIHVPTSDAALAFSGSSYWITKYKVAGYPTGIVDGRASVPNYSNEKTTQKAVEDVIKESIAYYPPKCGIAISTTLNGRELKTTVDLRVKKAGTYILHVGLIESGMTSKQNGYTGTYVNNNILRTFFTQNAGKTITVSTDGTEIQENFTYDIPSVWKSNNSTVIVFIQTQYEGSRTEKVSIVSYPDFGNYYVDNCASVKAGEKLDYKKE